MDHPMTRHNVSGFLLISARYNGRAGCGDIILKGDVIAYNPTDHRTLCEKCWRNLSLREAYRRDRDMQERMKLD